jgi:flagellar basal body-associated protein FliL
LLLSEKPNKVFIWGVIVMEDEVENLEETDREDDQEDSKVVADTKEESFINKIKLKKILIKVEKAVGVIVILFILGYTPFIIYGVIQEKDKIVIDDNIHKFPKVIKSIEKGIFRTKEFNITLDATPEDDKSIIVKTEIYLAYKKDHLDLKEELENRKKELEDRIQLIISSKDLYDINSADKREYALKKELINEVNSLLDKGKVEDLYFTNFFFTQIKKL